MDTDAAAERLSPSVFVRVHPWLKLFLLRLLGDEEGDQIIELRRRHRLGQTFRHQREFRLTAFLDVLARQRMFLARRVGVDEQFTFLAAEEAGQATPLSSLVEWYERVTVDAEFALIEGAGGWRVPLYPEGFLSDLPETLGLDVILVVGTTLGCLNHARLTVEAIHVAGRCRLLGWIANEIDPGFERQAANVATLERLLGAPPLAITGWTPERSAFGNAVLDVSGGVRLREALLAAVRR